jgi:hypothetical protein
MHHLHQTWLWKNVREHCPDAVWQWAKRGAYGFASYRRTRNFIARSEHRYRDDPRFDLDNVARGFAPRPRDGGDDTQLLERICAFYDRASSAQVHAGAVYSPASWWQRMQERGLTNVRHVLAERDVPSLRRMYQNFFRDPCSTGLIEQSYSRIAANFPGTPIPAPRQRFLMADALHRLDYWRKLTVDRFRLLDLAGPETGNPFGVDIDGVLVRTGAEYQHYCAQRVAGLLQSRGGTVGEIGGGYGGMAYYLLRDFPHVKYIGFDIPESLALTAYYLSKSLSERRLLLYGEAGDMASNDVILLPSCMLRQVPEKCADIIFSSQTMALLTPEAKTEYLHDIARITRGSFLCVGHSDELQNFMRGEDGSLTIVEKNASAWNDHCAAYPDEFEWLYGVGGT